MKKSISIFGSTGSIGKNAVEVILNSPSSYKIISIVANKDIKTLTSQAKVLKPEYVVIKDKTLEKELRESLKDYSRIKIMSGDAGVSEVTKIKCDLFISAVVGMAALMPTMNAIRAGSNIGLANKECLVSAGDILLKEAEKNQVKLIPIDSEHNAIFQIFEHDNLNLIKNITLTASGGPFFQTDIKEMVNITSKEAVKHPNWSMGAKISVDSATMMNKGLELIEAYRLFPIKKEQINIVIHPQSIIHGLVDYEDGSTLAMMSNPDMKTPIAYAIGYPERIKIKHQHLDLAKISTLNFFQPDEKKFPALELAKQALKSGGNAPCILNAANEIAVDRFLKDKILFTQIPEIIIKTLEKIPYSEANSLEQVIEFDRRAREVSRVL